MTAGHGDTTTWRVSATPAAVPVLRRDVRALLHRAEVGGLADLADDVELVLSELLSNTVLHAPGEVIVSLTAAEPGLLLEVTDTGAAMPSRRIATDSGTTGRGLNLVSSLTETWGAAARPDGLPGKVVWCRFGAVPRAVEPDLDVEALLASFDDGDAPGYEVTVGEAPTELVAAAKDHLDELLRELALAEGSVGGSLPHEIIEGITGAVSQFAEARAQLRREITRAQAEGRRRVLVRFSLPAELADAGEAYLEALAEADAHARDRRMLSLESPAAFRVLREWYVRALVDGLRRAATGQPPAEVPTFEEQLLDELQVQESKAREATLAAQLQGVTARLAAADTLEQIAEIAVAEGCLTLGASGGTLTRPADGRPRTVVHLGGDRGLQEWYDRNLGGALGPSSDAMRTRALVHLSGREDRDARYPHLAEVQPDALSVAAMPLTVVGEVVGAVRFTWSAPRLLTEAERAYLAGLAAQTAQAVARCTALRRLQETEAQSRVLAVLSERLAADRTVEGLIAAVVDAVVPTFADWAVVHLLDKARSTTQELPEGGVVVPLVARGVMLGALSVGLSGARLRPDTLAVLEDVGRRAGVALDNVRALGTSVRLDLALSAANVGSFELRLPSRELDGDARLLAMLAVEPGTFDGTLASFFARLLPEDASRTESAIARAVATVGELAVEYRVMLRDGSIRWLESRGQALPGLDGSTERLVGVVVDVTAISERRETQRQRDRAIARLRLLNDVGADLTATLDVDEALTRLAHRMVPVLGDLVSVDLRDDDHVLGTRGVVITAHDPARAAAMRRAEAALPRRNNPGSAVFKVLHGEPLVRVVVLPGYLEGLAVDEEQLATYQAIDMRFATVVPLIARGRVFGVLSLIRTGPGAMPYTDEEERLALELGRRAGLIVDNAAQYNAQRGVAEGLQRSLLPELPVVPGVRLGADYEPSSSAAKVGGDWYDAFVLPDGSLGLVIGDVMGHDIAAAAAMGQLRSVLRTCAAEGDEPGQVMDRLDRLVTTFAMADLATAVYAQVRLRPGGGADLSWSNAGHPPPLLLVPGEEPRYLEGGTSTMIGVELGEPRHPAAMELPAGSTLLMFTDGLVERRGADLDEGLERVRTTAGALAVAHPEQLCQRLIAAMRQDGSTDDVAVVALTLDGG